MYKRKTKDEYEIKGYYSPCSGWETVTTEETYGEAKKRLKEYRNNEPYAFKIVKIRIKI